MKLAYLALGLGLSFICTTGVDIWLAKSAARGTGHPRIQSVWTSFVWGTPAMLATAASLYMLWRMPPEPVFWIGLLSISLGGIWVSQQRLHWIGPRIAGVATLMLPAAHLSRFGADAMTFTGGAINAGFIATARILTGLAIRNKLKPGTVPFHPYAGPST